MEVWDEEVLSSGHAGHTKCVQLSRGLGEDSGGTAVLQHPGISAECSAQLPQQKGAGPRNLCGPQYRPDTFRPQTFASALEGLAVSELDSADEAANKLAARPEEACDLSMQQLSEAPRASVMVE